MNIEDPLKDLREAFEQDPSYLQSWFDNLASVAETRGVPNELANNIANDFVWLLFELKRPVWGNDDGAV